MGNKNYLKRFWAILLAAALCIGLLQMPGVYASEDASTEVAMENTTGDNTEVLDATSGDGTEESADENSGSSSDVQTSEPVMEITENTSETQETSETSGSGDTATAGASADASSETETGTDEEGSTDGISLMSILPEEDEPTVAAEVVNSSDISMKVTLDGTILSGTEAEVTGWEYKDGKELLVTITKEAGTACTVQIDLPMQVYATAYTSAEDTGISSFTFTDLAAQTGFEDLMVYTNRSVSTAVGYYATYRSGGVEGTLPSGTWTYVIDGTATTCTIAMTLKYDASLWSNVAETQVLTGSPVTIEVYEGSSIETGSTAASTVSLTSIKAGSTTMSYRDTMMYYKYGTSSSSTNFGSTLGYLEQSEGVVVQAFLDQWTENTTYLYYTDVTVTVTYPVYKASDGTKYYLTLDENGNFKNYKNQMIYFNRSGSYTNETETLKKTVTYSMIMPAISSTTGLPVVSAYLSMIPLCLPDDFEGDNETTSGLYDFTGGHVTMTGTTANGDTVTIYDQDISTITYKSKNYQGSEDVTVTETIKSVTVGLPDDAVTLLGGMMVANEGAGESEAKTILMEFDDELLVTDVNLLADTKQENITVTYTLKDQSGNHITIGGESNWTLDVENTYYGTSATGSGLCLALNTDMLPADQKEYYFASISYRVDSIDAQTYMYTTSGYASSSSPGNYFGYLANTAQDEDSLETAITVTAAGNTSFDEIKKTSITKVTTEDSSGYGIQNVSFSSGTVDSGNQVTLSGTIFVRGDYTSGINAILRNIHLGVVLPDGVEVGSVSLNDDLEYTLTPCDGEGGHPYYDVGDGYTLYLITPKHEDFYIGYYSIGLDESGNGSTLDFTLTLMTTQGMATTTLNSYDMLYVWGGDNQTNSPGGTYLAYQKTDTYDLNNNGNVSDCIGGMASASSVTCRITTTGGSMDETESAAANGSTNVSGKTYYTIASASDITTYTLSFKNNKSGTASGFVYYIPVPKVNVTSNFVSTAEFGYTLSDASAVSVASDAIGTDLDYTVYVTTESLGTYSAASADSVTWHAAGSYTGDWSAVTMIKVVVENDIEKNDDLTITVNYTYDSDSAQYNYAYYAGYINTWCSMGTYTYTIGKIVNGSVQTTDGKTAMVTYVDSASAEVTAQKSDITEDYNTDTSIVNIGIGSGFANIQNLMVTGVTMGNASMKLEDITTVQNTAKTMSSSTANTTFGLSLALNGSTSNVLDLSKWVQSAALELGNAESSSQNYLTLTLYNGDALTENMPLYVTVELTGTATDSNGNTVEDVTFTIELTIKREKAGVTASTAIDAGKSYVIFSGGNSVTINQDSAFTAQFSLNYVPSNYATGKTLSFGTNGLPADTTLLLIDVPMDSSGKNEDTNEERTYYSYTATGSETEVSLEAFTQIGGTASYSIPQDSSTVYETLLLIVDFSGCTDKPSAGTTYTVTLTQEGTGGTAVSPQGGLTCTITSAGASGSEAARSFNLAWEETETDYTEASYNTSYSFSYSSTITGDSDEYYIGKQLSLVVSVSDGSESLPDDAYLSVGGETCYRNADGKYLISLETLGTSNTGRTVSIELCSAAPTPATLTYALWVSATADGETPLMGDDTGKSVDVTYKVTEEPSFEVTDMSTRLVTSTSNALTVSYEYADFVGCKVTLELQKKSGSSYDTSTTDLVSVTVDGAEITLNSGVATLISNSDDSSGTGSAAFKLNGTLSGTATYRLLFSVYNASGTLIYEIPYNFIVNIE
ncbi:MAG: hypothetical protein LUC98_13695 [Lachnospiraceae bacterium]|nr:hypothetical protein [Lachnospiraceae bacterium]